MLVVWKILLKVLYIVIGIPILLLLWGALYIGGLLVDDCTGEPKPKVSWVEKAFHLQLDGAIMEEAWDTHGGFHYDGNTYIVLTLQTSIEEQITAINEEYAGETKSGGPWYSIGEYPLAYAGLLEEIKDFRGGGTGTQIPIEVENGYFCLINNFNNKDEYVFLSEDASLGSFWNWDFAVYDIDTMKLYYYESDM